MSQYRVIAEMQTQSGVNPYSILRALHQDARVGKYLVGLDINTYQPNRGAEADARAAGWEPLPGAHRAEFLATADALFEIMRRHSGMSFTACAPGEPLRRFARGQELPTAKAA